ncbi:UDP-N-acetylmuramoyl-L-alanyl-D-glutamate--2,6-diaminopimelate ligase [Saliniradius amylolyticus]|uniref:UDP-N-acetylmuramyl-tripeptide synthetase n=1 Tax=Saliniradius amylolyticus TaxID=2183582 RepID=A0A2S2E7J5_9ALTE|nr:UDP-N-acetylmuramoyl-L-alanyl-D-glutamate--2,6-diaminopimelate ligase [Saliniradius amylolyticus]AWL12927.1 UDP-N-acetylmuramoyl-L-alanyl-D-glutamate--2,6-diaminopimelate ligase [Saliniradius amylolyticus]
MNPESVVMNLRDLLMPFGIDAPAIELTEMVLDSREVAIHKLFVAISGHQLDGRDFIPQAVSLGAKAILAETDDEAVHGQMEMREQSMIVQFYRLKESLSALAAVFYSQPAEAMNVVAVTGTNGKTSTVQLTAQLAERLGQKAGTIGTLGAGPMDRLSSLKNTTPDAISIQRLMADMRSQGVQQVAMEASSHALVQHRLSSLKTDVAVFTNLSRDHLDYHGDMNRYAAAKRLLIQQPGLKHLVLNGDDAESENWLRLANPRQQVTFYGLNAPRHPEQPYIRAEQIVYQPTGTRFRLVSPYGEAEIQTALMGAFNVSNLLAAISAQLVTGARFDELVKQAPQLTPVPGRLEIFQQGDSPSLIVDFAHTPDALEKALEALGQHTQGKVVCVFGCGGDRDAGKRPLMGAIAERLADEVIITNDNSRSEDPAKIAADIQAGMTNPGAAQVELDRQQAIRRAFQQASKGDLVLLAGKGHEPYQIIGDQTINYNERQFAEDLVKGITQ